jgi:hypothetical protein
MDKVANNEGDNVDKYKSAHKEFGPKKMIGDQEYV